MRKTLLLSIALTAMFVALTLSANANSLPPGLEMDFAGGSGGNVNFNPAVGNVFTVSDAPISSVEQFPSNKFFGITGGYLDLVTGGCMTGCQYFQKGQQETAFFQDGGDITLFGALPEFGISMTKLFEGTFDHTAGSKIFGHKNCQFTNVTLNNKTHKGGLNGCIDVEFVDPQLLAALNFLTGGGGKGFLSQLFFNLTFSNGWNGSVMGTDMQIIPGPEPASLVLMGSGLLLGGSVLRRRFTSK